MVRLLLLIGLGLGLFLVFRWLFSQPPRVYWQWLAVLLAAGLLMLVLTGRAHWLAVVFAALLPLLHGGVRAKVLGRGSQTAQVAPRNSNP